MPRVSLPRLLSSSIGLLIAAVVWGTTTPRVLDQDPPAPSKPSAASKEQAERVKESAELKA